jgi:type II secretory pathway component PulM
VNVRELWAAARRWYDAHSERDRRVILGVAVAVGLSLVYIAVVEPIRGYRRGVAEEIGEGQEQLERAARFLGAIDSLRAERDDLRKRLEQAKTHLIPGDSGTLGAAALQERANAIASEKGITVQSTQVMKEETVEPFRKVAVRLTLSGELKPFADFVAGLEYGPQQLKIPFVEVSRRGAVPNAKGPRTLSATVEVSGYLLASAKGEGGKAAEPEAEGEADNAAAPDAEPGGGAPAADATPPAGEAPPPAAATPPTPDSPPTGPPPPAVQGPPVPAPPAVATEPGATPPKDAAPAPAPPAPPPAAPAPAAGAT